MKDPYIQENGILKNKLGITDYNELNNAERDVTFTKFLNIGRTYKTQFDSKYFKSIHKHIFEDIFDWAGKFRTVPIVKEEIVIPRLSLDYAPAKEIQPRLDNVLKRMNAVNWEEITSLDEKSMLFTQYLTEIWAIHPFRDGNTRTTLTFANQFAKEHGFPLDLGSLLDKLPRKLRPDGSVAQYSIRDKFVLAVIPKEYSPEPEHLNALIHQSMINGIKQNIETLQNNLKTSSMNPPSSKTDVER